MSLIHYYSKTYTYRKYRLLCMGAMIVVVTFFVAYVAVILLNCIPMSMWWDTSVEGSCLNQGERLFITAAVNVGVDGFVLLLSLPILGKVEMPQHKKVLGFVIVTAGLGVCAVAGIRLFYLSQGGIESTIDYRLTSLLEADTATIVACLPLLYPLVQRMIYGKDGRADSPTGSEQSQAPMLRRTPGSGSTLRPSGSALAHREEKSGVAWPLSNVDPELGMVEQQYQHEKKVAAAAAAARDRHDDDDPRRTPSVEQAIHGRVSGGARLVQLPPNAKRLSAEDLEARAPKKPISPQDLESEWGRMTARQIQAASWGREKASRKNDIPQIDQWFEGFDS